MGIRDMKTKKLDLSSKGYTNADVIIIASLMNLSFHIGNPVLALRDEDDEGDEGDEGDNKDNNSRISMQKSDSLLCSGRIVSFNIKPGRPKKAIKNHNPIDYTYDILFDNGMMRRSCSFEEMSIISITN